MSSNNLLKIFNPSLNNHLKLFFITVQEPITNDQQKNVDNILFENVKNEINSMLENGVSKFFIVYYIVTLTHMLVATNKYDLIQNYNKLKKTYSLLFTGDELNSIIKQAIILSSVMTLQLHNNSMTYVDNIIKKIDQIQSL